MSIRSIRFVFTLWIVPIPTLLSAELDEIESRMDQLLERLNKMEPSNSSQPVEAPPIPLDLSSSGQDELPSIPLPPLLSHNTTASKSEAPTYSTVSLYAFYRVFCPKIDTSKYILDTKCEDNCSKNAQSSSISC